MSFQGSIKVIVFKMADQFFGVDVGQVMSIERVSEITSVPHTISFVKGIINLRGVVTPVIDLRERLGLPTQLYVAESRLIVVRNNDYDIALIVDAANDVMDIDGSIIEPPPAVIGGVQAVYLSGVAKLKDRLLVLLNLNRILNDSEVAQVQMITEV